MTKLIPIVLARRLTLFLDNKDLKALANALRQFRSASIETLILRNKPFYKWVKASELEKQLFIAAKLGMTDWVLKCIQAGVNVNVSIRVNNHLIQPIHYAALSGVLSCVKALVDHDAIFLPAQPTKYFNSPLHFAAVAGNPEIVTYFLDRNVPIDQEAAQEFWLGSTWTSLQIAVHHKKTACAAILIARKANLHHVNLSGYQAIHLAVEVKDNVGIINLLLSADADVHAKTAEGVTPLMHAMRIFTCHTNIQALLLGGANAREPNVLNNYIMPLAHLISNRLLDAAQVLLDFDKTLIDACESPKPNIKIWLGDRTALHVAVELDYAIEVQFLLEHKADPEMTTHLGKKAADLVRNRNGEIAKLLGITPAVNEQNEEKRGYCEISIMRGPRIGRSS